MISCTEFIPLYSELFKFLEEKNGKKEVIKYWEYISDEYIASRLGDAVKKSGIKGCFEYWSKSLNEEACGFTMSLDEENSEFTIEMHSCPSKGMLNNLTYMEPYHDYCGHCELLYKRVLERYGLALKLDSSQVDKAKCMVRVNLSTENNKNNI